MVDGNPRNAFSRTPTDLNGPVVDYHFVDTFVDTFIDNHRQKIGRGREI